MSEGEALSVSYNVQQLGDAAIGSIGPEARIAAGEIVADRVDDLASRLQGNDFYDDIGELGPNAAGGTFSLVIADALTTSRFRAPGQDAARHSEVVFKWLMEHKNDAASRRIIPRVCIDGRLPIEGSPRNTAVIGGHDDEHGPGGCGAQGKLGPILEYIAQRGDVLHAQAAYFGITVDDAIHALIVGNAARLLDKGYVVPGEQIRQAYVAVAGEASVTKLAGEHPEVAAGINKDKTRSLSRTKVRDAFGEAYKAFDADVGIFPEAAAAVSEGNQEAQQKFVAMLYFNLATTDVLSHKSLRLVEHA